MKGQLELPLNVKRKAPKPPPIPEGMRGTAIFTGSELVVSASWLNDFRSCQKRAQLGLFARKRKETPEATAGTLLHYCIEMYLHHSTLSPRVGLLTAMTEEKFGKVEDIFVIPEEHKWFSEAEGHADHHFEFFVDLALDGFSAWKKARREGVITFSEGPAMQIEVGETVHIPNINDKVDVWIHGTPDLTDHRGVMWDWKFSERRWVDAEEQKYSLQPTVYSIVNGLLPASGVGDANLKSYFNYCVVNPRTFEVRIVPVWRGMEHVHFMRRLLSQVVTMATLMGPTVEWPMTGKDWLCSPKWCEYWDQCLGDPSIGMEEGWVAPPKRKKS